MRFHRGLLQKGKVFLSLKFFYKPNVLNCVKGFSVAYDLNLAPLLLVPLISL